MVSSGLFAPLVVLVAACAGRDAADEPAEPAPRDLPAAPFGTTRTAVTPAPESAAPRESPPEVQTFAERVLAIGRDGRPDHAGIVQALAALDAALVVVGNADPVARDRLRYAAGQLGEAAASSPMHADYARSAFDAAIAIAAGGSPRSPADTARYRAAVARLVELVDGIDPDRPLLEQQARVVDALEATVRVLYAAIGLPSPFERAT